MIRTNSTLFKRSQNGIRQKQNIVLEEFIEKSTDDLAHLRHARRVHRNLAIVEHGALYAVGTNEQTVIKFTDKGDTIGKEDRKNCTEQRENRYYIDNTMYEPLTADLTSSITKDINDMTLEIHNAVGIDRHTCKYILRIPGGVN